MDRRKLGKCKNLRNLHNSSTDKQIMWREGQRMLLSIAVAFETKLLNYDGLHFHKRILVSIKYHGTNPVVFKRNLFKRL